MRTLKCYFYSSYGYGGYSFDTPEIAIKLGYDDFKDRFQSEFIENVENYGIDKFNEEIDRENDKYQHIGIFKYEYDETVLTGDLAKLCVKCSEYDGSEMLRLSSDRLISHMTKEKLFKNLDHLYHIYDNFTDIVRVIND